MMDDKRPEESRTEPHPRGKQELEDSASIQGGASRALRAPETSLQSLLSWSEDSTEDKPQLIRALSCTHFEMTVSSVGLGLLIETPSESETVKTTKPPTPHEPNRPQPWPEVHKSEPNSTDTGQDPKRGERAHPARWPEAHKQELSRVALLVDQIATEHGLLAPLIVVLVGRNDDELRTIEQWATEQEWHKGRFSLFSAKRFDQGKARLQELLSPRAADPVAREGPNDIRRIHDRVLEKLEIENGASLSILTRNLLLEMAPTATAEDYRTAIDGFFAHDTREGGARGQKSGDMSATAHGDEEARGKPEPAKLAPSTEVDRRSVEGEDPVDRKSEGQGPKEHAAIARVKKATIKHFRGFREGEGRPLDLDADLVLVLGANGHGKSSFMEALLVGLTGHATADHRPALRVTRPTRAGDDDAKRQAAPEAPSISLTIAETLDEATKPRRDACIKVNAPSTEEEPWEFTRTIGDNGEPSKPWRQPVETPFLEPKDKDPSTPRGKFILTDYAPGTALHPELQYRLTAFLQDSHQDLFDERSSAKTLRNILEVTPERVAVALNAIKEKLDDFSFDGDRRGRIPDIEERLAFLSPEAGERHRERLQQATETVADLYKACQSLPDATEWPPIPSTPEEWGDTTVRLLRQQGNLSDKRRDKVLTEPWKALLEVLEKTITDEIHRLRKVLGLLEAGSSGDGMDGAARILELERILNRMEKELADLRSLAESSESVLRWLSPDFPTGTTLPKEGQLTTLLRLLKEWAAAWSGTGDPSQPVALPKVTVGPIQPVVEELALVDVSKAAELHRLVEAWELKHRGASERLHALEVKYAEYQVELARLQEDERLKHWRKQLEDVQDLASSARLSELNHAWHQLQGWVAGQNEVDALKKELQGLKKAQEDLKDLFKAFQTVLGPSLELKKALQKQVNRLLSRFALTRGLQEMELASVSEESAADDESPRIRFQLHSKDGRSLPHFSTGQRGQIAISWMLAQRQLVQEDPRVPFPHRLLLLDDVSTAYDLTNLVRETLLWRQLAYHPEQDRRFQVVLSSHHDDLTNRMLDLLTPPHGCSLRVLTFDDWNPEKGPTIHEYGVDPAPEISPKWKKNFLKDIQEGV